MDGLSLSIQQHLETKPARYALRRSELKSIFLSAGRYEMTQNIFLDQMPRRVIVAMVENAAYVGDKKKSPFNFKPFDIREISVTSGGTSYPFTPYSLDFPNGKYVRAYHDSMEGVGCANSLESNGIDMARFKNGWTVFCFVLTSTLSNESGFELI